MVNVLLALQALSSVLALIEQGSEASMKISAVISKARAENRDITDEELAEVVSASKAMEQDIIKKLDELIKDSTS